MLTAALSARLRSVLAGPLLRRFARQERGVSAVEFALLTPVIILLIGGTAEFSGAITAANRATFVADAVAEMVSRTDHKLNAAELKNFAVSSPLADIDIIKYARQSGQDVESAFKVTITSVQFDKVTASCQINCIYLARTVFSYTLNGSKRPCGLLTAASGQSNDASTLPADVYGPGSLVVVDVETRYRPLTLVKPAKLASTMTFKRSSYFRPRYVSRVTSDSNCTGF